MKYTSLFLAGLLTVLLSACRKTEGRLSSQEVFPQGCYPHVTLWQGCYYATLQHPSTDSIVIYAHEDPAKLATGRSRCVWHDGQMRHIWSPELHRVNSKWYLYFEADDGNTDNHQLYVLENASDDPMKGEFQMKGVIHTNDEWNFGLHPTSIIVRGQQYLLWSGWQHRRLEEETQCIYIARMQNPWTLGSERVLLSQPEYEWERQWINPDGLRSNYPIFVNENPEAFVSDDGRYVCVCYSASGIWTIYCVMGMLYAPADADLLNPQSWTKSQEPLFVSDNPDLLHGTSNISLVPSADGQQYLLFYEAQWTDEAGLSRRGIRMQPIGWEQDGLPAFGQPG